MSKLNNLNVSSALMPFKKSLGESFTKVEGDIKSMLGRLDKDIIAKAGEWKAGASFKLTSKEGYTLQLPLNNPAAQLLCFGMRANELADKGGMDVECTIPKNCEAWVEQHRKNAHTVAA